VGEVSRVGFRRVRALPSSPLSTLEGRLWAAGRRGLAVAVGEVRRRWHRRPGQWRMVVVQRSPGGDERMQRAGGANQGGGGEGAGSAG
jgi:hypothetical protein